MRVLAHVTEHVHADALVEHFLQFVRKRKVFDHQGVQGESIFREGRFEGLADLFGKRALIRGHIEEGHLAGGKRVGHLRDYGVAQLAFEIRDAIEVARAADLAVERFGIAQVIGVNAEATKTDSPEFLVADGDGILRAPVLVGLNSRGEEIDIGLEGRLERFVPVLQISQDGQRLRIQGIESRAKNVRNLPLIHKNRGLRIANGQLAAVLDLAILHGIAIGQDAFFRLNPLDDIDKLLGDEVAKAHERPLFRRES